MSGEQGQGMNKTAHRCCVHPWCFKISNAPFLTMAFASAQCIDVQQGDCQTGASTYGTRKTCCQDIDIWQSKGVQRCADTSDASTSGEITMTPPKMDSKKYGIAHKDNEMRDQLKKGVDHPTWLPTPI
ncbi:hypothetical protein IW261DRAFT_1420274 [Armillaria novae-zelandiae]|uniref:Uncharacterized protein n=1 Tax=Armillaria novae-zelandiae TaxID=153914 RepID=A0AA39TBX2_9AGAR|nr:hypothetical protein IW261DRAFT_1420274 [Armillaria novae-zelandiae]